LRHVPERAFGDWVGPWPTPQTQKGPKPFGSGPLKSHRYLFQKSTGRGADRRRYRQILRGATAYRIGIDVSSKLHHNSAKTKLQAERVTFYLLCRLSADAPASCPRRHVCRCTRPSRGGSILGNIGKHTWQGHRSHRKRKSSSMRR
jgi:hypothetical protein